MVELRSKTCRDQDHHERRFALWVRSFLAAVGFVSSVSTLSGGRVLASSPIPIRLVLVRVTARTTRSHRYGKATPEADLFVPPAGCLTEPAGPKPLAAVVLSVLVRTRCNRVQRR